MGDGVERTKMTSKRIQVLADEIREKLSSKGIVTLYGEVVDFSNPDTVLVAAVLMTEMDARQEALKDIRLLKVLGEKALNTIE